MYKELSILSKEARNLLHFRHLYKIKGKEFLKIKEMLDDEYLDYMTKKHKDMREKAKINIIKIQEEDKNSLRSLGRNLRYSRNTKNSVLSIFKVKQNYHEL